MKTFLKHLSLIGLGMMLILALQTSSFSRDVLAQITGQFAKPVLVSQQGNQTYNTLPETTQQVDYALPLDVNLHNLIGNLGQSQSMHDSIIAKYAKATPLFQDINGDGLVDIVYSYYYNGYSNYSGGGNVDVTDQYVMLNNGQGFDLVYKCNRNGNHYTGDCAKTP